MYAIMTYSEHLSRIRSIALAVAVITGIAHADPPLAPNVTWPPTGAMVGSNRLDLTWTGSANDMYEIHIGSSNVPTSANVWNSGQVPVGQPATTAQTPALTPQQT